MSADDPQVGDLWSLPNQPTLTTSGEGGRGVIVETDESRVTLITEMQGRRILLAPRSLLLTWVYERSVRPEQCSFPECSTPARFYQIVDGSGRACCPNHYQANQRVYFRESPDLHCPVCNNAADFLVQDLLTIETCSRCRNEWLRVNPESTECQTIVRRILVGVRILEERGGQVRLRMGSPTFRLLQPSVSSGNPPHLQGIPIGVFGQDLQVYIIGSRPTAAGAKGVQQLGSLGGISRPEIDVPSPSSSPSKTFTNDLKVTPQSSSPRNLSPGAQWWHKTQYEQVYVVEVGTHSSLGMYVTFRADGVLQRLPLEQFMAEYQLDLPQPPCQLDEEWVDSRDHVVRVVYLDEQGATVQSTTGARYLLPYKQFSRWKKIERKSVYDRLVEDDD